jgi:hypothetical protein
MKYTPEIITTLLPNEVFVFGTNQFANHAGGAAKIAKEKFGAIDGSGAIGLVGQCYGIITTSFNEVPISLGFIYQQLQVLYEFAKTRPDLIFYVTKIGIGIAGFTITEIASLFKSLEPSRTTNIILPIEFN